MRAGRGSFAQLRAIVGVVRLPNVPCQTESNCVDYEVNLAPNAQLLGNRLASDVRMFGFRLSRVNGNAPIFVDMNPGSDVFGMRRLDRLARFALCCATNL